MCLIVFAHHTHPKYPFILLANRDEYHERPTQQMDFWGGTGSYWRTGFARSGYLAGHE